MIRRQPTDAPPSPCIPPGTRVYAIGDVHGRLDLLQSLLKTIREDAKDGPERRVLVFLGDVIDRGPQSSEVIEYLVRHRRDGFEWVMLRGDHEALMSEILDGAADPAVQTWLSNGGDMTVKSYGISMPKVEARTPEVLARLGLALRAAVPPRHRRWLGGLQNRHREGDYLFVHAGVRPGVALDAQKDRDLLWIREPFLSATKPLGAMIVHGHSITETPDIRQNRIGIDTGAYRSNILTCLVLEGLSQRFFST